MSIKFKRPAKIVKSLTALSLLVLVTILISCAGKKTREFSAKAAIDSIKKSKNTIHSVRGRIWISYYSAATNDTDEIKGSFPAVIAIDLKDQHKPRMRFEAIDLLGATHALVIIDRNATMTWIDYDQKKVYKIKNSWNGIPLEYFPQLLTGLAPLPEDGRVSTVTQDGFEIETKVRKFLYMMEWIDPGPRLALSILEGRFKNMNARPARDEKFTVKYSKFKEIQDHYMPEQLIVRGYHNPNSQSLHESNVKIEVNWRERRWNDEMKDQLFAIPQVKFD